MYFDSIKSLVWCLLYILCKFFYIVLLDSMWNLFFGYYIIGILNVINMKKLDYLDLRGEMVKWLLSFYVIC